VCRIHNTTPKRFSKEKKKKRLTGESREEKEL
jgi:hypothetical protein